MYGRLNTDIDGFFSTFPKLVWIDIEYNDLTGFWPNFDAISSQYFSNLDQFIIGHNYFTGSITMTQGLQLPQSLVEFDVDHNDFHGQIQWDIFDGLYSLEALDLNDNNFNGTINWTIIADLHNNGNLRHIEMHDNYFSGFVDFSWINDTSDIDFELDAYIPCMLIIVLLYTFMSLKKTIEMIHVFLYRRSNQISMQ